MYVIRALNEVPEFYEEYFYDEVVGIKNGIGLVTNEHVLNALTGGYNQYEYVGTIDKSDELKDLLTNFDYKKKDESISLEVRKKVFTMEDILKHDIPKENEPKTLLDRIEERK